MTGETEILPDVFPEWIRIGALEAVARRGGVVAQLSREPVYLGNKAIAPSGSRAVRCSRPAYPPAGGRHVQGPIAADDGARECGIEPVLDLDQRRLLRCAGEEKMTQTRLAS